MSEEILNQVWKYLACDKPKPKIIMRRQHSTALYWPDKPGLDFRHTISLREDSWRIMSPAEKKLVVIHESLHACGVPHQQGFRTALDEVAHVLYQRIYGDDKDWKDFSLALEDKLKKIRKEKEFSCDEETPEGACPYDGEQNL